VEIKILSVRINLDVAPALDTDRMGIFELRVTHHESDGTTPQKPARECGSAPP